jgi:hypothetical protein
MRIIILIRIRKDTELTASKETLVKIQCFCRVEERALRMQTTGKQHENVQCLHRAKCPTGTPSNKVVSEQKKKMVFSEEAGRQKL